MKSQFPRVSILMPYFRCGDFLQEAVESVCLQTYKNWELIIVDDCSPENPVHEVLSSTDDARIKFFRKNANEGVAAARNYAAKQSTGEILLPLDGDDKLHETYIEKTLNAMIENGTAAAHTDVQIFGMHNYSHKPIAQLGAIFAGQLPYNTFIYKREIFDAVDGYRAYGSIDDTDFWIRVLELNTSFAYVPEPLYLYRRRPDSLSQTNKNVLGEHFLSLIEEKEYLVVKHLPSILRHWLDFATREQERAETDTNLQEKYTVLHAEFHTMLAKYKDLEEQSNQYEALLGNMPAVLRQMARIGIKHLQPRN